MAWRRGTAMAGCCLAFGVGLAWSGCASGLSSPGEDVASVGAGGAGGAATTSSSHTTGGGDGGSGGDGAGGMLSTGGSGGGGAGPGCGDGIVDPPEQCDGASNANCEDLGYAGGLVPCKTDCKHDLSVCSGCGNGVIEFPLQEDCDFDAQGTPLVIATCASLDFPLSSANPGCNPVTCKFDTAPCHCGDGILDSNEECDGTSFGTATCQSEGFTQGMLACTPDCTLDTAGCTACGDGSLDPGEQCDGTDLGDKICSNVGFTAGDLACAPNCTFDTSACTKCGNGVTEPGEQCDDSNSNGGDGCSATCQLEACDPDGVYIVTGAAPSYSCCSGLVSVSVSSFILSSNGAAIASSPSNPALMTGAATTCPAGNFSNAASIPGGCTENYTLTGSFTSADTWTGVYSVSFTGPDCDCFGGILGTPCVNQVFPVSAQR